MLKAISRIFEQYVTCKHQRNTVVREILDHSTVSSGKTMQWYDRINAKNVEESIIVVVT